MVIPFASIIGKMSIILYEHFQHCFRLEMSDIWQKVRLLYYLKFEQTGL